MHFRSPTCITWALLRSLLCELNLLPPLSPFYPTFVLCSLAIPRLEAKALSHRLNALWMRHPLSQKLFTTDCGMTAAAVDTSIKSLQRHTLNSNSNLSFTRYRLKKQLRTNLLLPTGVG